jgi:phosphatidylglycerophosphate synthase
LNHHAKSPTSQAFFLWLLLVLVSLPLAVAMALAFGIVAPAVSLALFVLIGVFVLVYMPPDYPLERFGIANSVTLLRGALVSWLAGFIGLPELITDTHLAWSLLTTAFIVLLLDGLDGWLARKKGQTSSFGAKFDMEVDSLFAIVLSLLVWQSDKVGWWVLLLGLPRPMFIVAAWFEPRLKSPLPDSMLRKTICVIQIAVLILLLAPVINPLTSQALAAMVLILLAGSFWRDTRWLLTKRSVT